MAEIPLTLGKYEILQEIGRGGFAVIYQARDTESDRVVALKVLAPHLSWDQTFVQRFQNEAQAVARLRHPNIIEIYDSGEADGRLFIAMACLSGRNLYDLLTQGPLPPERAINILGQIATALDHAHSQGLIHRDVKPSNVLIELRGRYQTRAVLTDFGLVKALEQTQTLTTQGTLIGSPEYMAPEQADPNRRDEIGPATDLYALGIVAYQLLAGTVPFPGNTPATLNAHLNLKPPDPLQVRPELPLTVVPVLLKALAKRPEDRYGSACELVNALRLAFVDPDALATPEVVYPPPKLDEPPPQPEQLSTPSVSTPSMPGWEWVFLAGVVVVVILFFGLYLFGARPAKPAPTATPTATSPIILPTSLPSPSPSLPPVATNTPPPLNTPRPATPLPQAPTPTHTQTPSATPTHTASPTPTNTDTPTPSPTPTPARARVTVLFTQVWVINDAETIGKGEIYFSFTVNNRTVYWPREGHVEIESGERRQLDISPRVIEALDRTQVLRIEVTGRENDPLGQGNLGRVSPIYTSDENWGEGRHTVRSVCPDKCTSQNCPDGCFVVYYEIEVEWLY